MHHLLTFSTPEKVFNSEQMIQNLQQWYSTDVYLIDISKIVFRAEYIGILRGIGGRVHSRGSGRVREGGGIRRRRGLDGGGGGGV